MRLVDAYKAQGYYDVLWALLQEREPHESISHRAMPSWEEHCAFVASRPYRAWCLVMVYKRAVGACYLSDRGEIGVAILKQFRRRGLAKAAVQALMAKYPGERFLANINPANERSIALFRTLGFGGPIQVTLEKSA